MLIRVGALVRMHLGVQLHSGNPPPLHFGGLVVLDAVLPPHEHVRASRVLRPLLQEQELTVAVCREGVPPADDSELDGGLRPVLNCFNLANVLLSDCIAPFPPELTQPCASLTWTRIDFL